MNHLGKDFNLLKRFFKWSRKIAKDQAALKWDCQDRSSPQDNKIWNPEGVPIYSPQQMILIIGLKFYFK